MLPPAPNYSVFSSLSPYSLAHYYPVLSKQFIDIDAFSMQKLKRLKTRLCTRLKFSLECDVYSYCFYLYRVNNFEDGDSCDSQGHLV